MENWKSEFKRCLLDTSRCYMIEKYIFKQPLWESQKLLLETIKNNKITVAVKSRSVGYTSILAAFTACEMALNCEKNNENRSAFGYYDIMYIAPNACMGAEFRNLVLRFLEQIPTELWSDEIVSLKQSTTMRTNRQLIVNYARLTISYDNKIIFSDTNSKYLHYVLYDEPVAGRDNVDIEKDIANCGYPQSINKVVVGSCSNHKNDSWFNFAKDTKSAGGYIEMPWWASPKCRSDKNDEPIYMCDSDNLDGEYTNRWFRTMRELMGGDSDNFQDEFGAKVWKYKKVKECV